jgi:hypothetical protein
LVGKTISHYRILALPNGQTGLGFMKPNENCTPSAFMHSS